MAYALFEQQEGGRIFVFKVYVRTIFNRYVCGTEFYLTRVEAESLAYDILNSINAGPGIASRDTTKTVLLEDRKSEKMTVSGEEIVELLNGKRLITKIGEGQNKIVMSSSGTKHFEGAITTNIEDAGEVVTSCQ